MSRLAPLHAVAPLIIWTLLAFCPRVTGFELSAAFALLVAYPLALRIDRDSPGWLRSTALFAGVVAAISIAIPSAPATAFPAACWWIFALPNLAYGLVRFVNAPRKREAVVWAEAASVTGPVVGAWALVCSRGRGDFCGFPEPLAILTVTHFHFTFGLLPISLAALTRALRATDADAFSKKLADAGLWAVVLAPPVVGLFFALRAEKLTPAPIEAAATVALALGVAIWNHVAAWKLAPSLPRPDAWALRTACLALTLASALAAWFSVSLAAGKTIASYGEMLRWHGMTNAVATVALALVAMRATTFHGMTAEEPAPDEKAPTTDIPPETARFRDDRVFDFGPDSPGRFEILRDALLSYRFYPESVMRSTATFKTGNRPARVGDRIGMSLAVPIFPGLPPMRFPATTEVNLAESGPGFAEFGYVTTRRHYGRGAWRAELSRKDGRITLRIRSHMTPTHPLALLGLPFYRFLQKRAHRLGAENLKNTAP